MKRIIPSLILMAFLFGCSQIDDDFNLQTKSEDTQTINYNVTIESATKFTNILDKGAKTIESIRPIAMASDTLLYVVNYSNNEGWIIISGDKRTQSILASSENGKFDVENSNPGVQLWFDDMAENIYALKHSNKVDTISIDYKLWTNIEKLNSTKTNGVSKIKKSAIIDNGYWEIYNVTSETLPSIQVGPLIKTKWGQRDQWATCVPYNKDFTARCRTGCVAVAGAQMMYYLHYKLGVPTTAYSTGSCVGWAAGDNYSYGFSFTNPSTTVWDLMGRYSYSSGTDYSAILMGYTGYSIGMKYDALESGAKTQNLVSFFSNNGISSSYKGYNYSEVIAQLKVGLPVITSAYATKKTQSFLGIVYNTYYDDGHAWIIDGYESKRVKYTYYYQWVPYDGSGEVALKSASLVAPVEDTKTEESISSTTYLIMNWGWSGSEDTGRYSTTGDWVASSYNFRYERAIIADFAKK